MHLAILESTNNQITFSKHAYMKTGSISKYLQNWGYRTSSIQSFSTTFDKATLIL